MRKSEREGGREDGRAYPELDSLVHAAGGQEAGGKGGEGEGGTGLGMGLKLPQGSRRRSGEEEEGVGGEVWSTCVVTERGRE